MSEESPEPARTEHGQAEIAGAAHNDERQKRVGITSH
jgi:hypothetical protein